MNAADVDSQLRQLMANARGPLAGAIRFILANKEEIPVRSMRELAKRAKVPPVTLVRLAQKLGFDGFDDFREVYVDAFINGDGRNRGRAAQLMSLARSEGALGFAAKFADGEFEVQRQTLANLQEKQLTAAVDALVSAERVFVMGRRNFYAAAYTLAYTLRKAKPNTHLLDTGGGIGVELDGITKKDVFVGFTTHPYSRITYGLAQAAKSQGATVISVTDSENAPIADISDHVFVTLIQSFAFPDSISGALLLAYTLVGLTVSRLGDRALETIQRNEMQIKNSGEYLVSPAPRSRNVTLKAMALPKGSKRKRGSREKRATS